MRDDFSRFWKGFKDIEKENDVRRFECFEEVSLVAIASLGVIL